MIEFALIVRVTKCLPKVLGKDKEDRKRPHVRADSINYTLLQNPLRTGRTKLPNIYNSSYSESVELPLCLRKKVISQADPLHRAILGEKPSFSSIMLMQNPFQQSSLGFAEYLMAQAFLSKWGQGL